MGEHIRATAEAIKVVTDLKEKVGGMVEMFYTKEVAKKTWEDNQERFAALSKDVIDACTQAEGVDLGKAYLISANIYLHVLRAIEEELVSLFAELSTGDRLGLIEVDTLDTLKVVN